MNTLPALLSSLSTLSPSDRAKLDLLLHLTCYRHECCIKGHNVTIYSEEQLKPTDVVEMVEIDNKTIFARKLEAY